MFYAFDPQGATAHMIDSSGGPRANGFFDGYGYTRAAPQAYDDHYGAGAQWGSLSTTGTSLIVMGARIYDPLTGRWISRDPIGYEGGENLYGYGDNNPVNEGDPSGLDGIPNQPILRDAVDHSEDVDPDDDDILSPLNRNPSAATKQLVAGERAAVENVASAGVPIPAAEGEVITEDACAVGRNYAKTFFDAHPNLNPANTIVHHAIPQAVLRRYSGLFKEAEIHGLENLRGISSSINNWLHLGAINRRWNSFYRDFPNATRGQIQKFSGWIDNQFRGNFLH